MKIVGSQLPVSGPPRVGSAQAVSSASGSSASAPASPATSQAPASPSAAVVVSKSAESASLAQTKSDKDVEKRIEVLRTSIAAGEYKPDLDRLAQKFVDEERSRAAGGGHERR